MFWLGMSIFIILAVSPFVSAAILNAKDGVSSAKDDQLTPPTTEER
jgi:hypothetical protein